MPSNPDYNFNLAGLGGPFSGITTAYLGMLGTSDVEHYTRPESVVMFLLFLFLMVVVMMNLLIAIMSDSYERVRSSRAIRNCACVCAGRALNLGTYVYLMSVRR